MMEINDGNREDQIFPSMSISDPSQQTAFMQPIYKILLP